MIVLSPREDESTKRPRGRPIAPEPKTSISAWIPIRHYDRLQELARGRDASLSRLVGEAVDHLIKQQRRPR
jgi:hypothetical protein